MGVNQNFVSIAKEPSKEMPGSFLFPMGVFSDDFATVDIREELCYHSRPKKQNSERLRKTDNNGIFRIASPFVYSNLMSRYKGTF